MRRRMTTAITMLVLVGIVTVGAWVGWSQVVAPMPGISAGKSCTIEPVEVTLKAADVQVSVYNAGSRAGLAGDTLKVFTRRGFRAGSLGNVEDKVRTVEIRSSVKDSPDARLVALQLGKKVQAVYSDVDLGPGIDVIVGNGFKGFSKAVTKIKYIEERQVCS